MQFYTHRGMPRCSMPRCLDLACIFCTLFALGVSAETLTVGDSVIGPPVSGSVEPVVNQKPGAGLELPSGGSGAPDTLPTMKPDAPPQVEGYPVVVDGKDWPHPVTANPLRLTGSDPGAAATNSGKAQEVTAGRLVLVGQPPATGSGGVVIDVAAGGLKLTGSSPQP
jgi:hypothetical protein